MNPLILIGAIAVVPVALIFLRRVNAGMVFLALGAGNLLVQYLGDDVLQLFNSFFPSSSEALHASVQIGLLILPALLTILFMRHSVSGSKYMFNVLPAALTGAVSVLLIVPFLTDGAKYTVMTSDVWSKIQTFQGVIVGAATLTSLMLLWGSNKHVNKKKHS